MHRVHTGTEYWVHACTRNHNQSGSKSYVDQCILRYKKKTCGYLGVLRQLTLRCQLISLFI